jgi:uncharacterized protein YdiU (UPF0061 family)
MLNYLKKQLKMNPDKIPLINLTNKNSCFNNQNKDKNTNTKILPKEIQFTNTYLKNLFTLKLENNKKPQSTRNTNYAYVNPTPLKQVKLMSLSPISAENLLDLDYEKILENQNEKKEFEEYFSGNKILPFSEPAAHCYVGHQFGVFAGQLGDGRAISLGDYYNSNNELVEVQLKGSGLTPYSRHADGRAVKRSSIREYLASEHLFSLGIPTTRALSIIGSESFAARDPLYDGNVIEEECCVVTRLAPSFIRFGSFEIFKTKDLYSGKSGPSVGLENDMLPKMLDYIINFHYKEIKNLKLIEKDGNYQCEKIEENLENIEISKENNNENIEDYKKLIYLITERTALLVSYWQSYGFCHGVLNTDNMSIAGLTIDYGPYGFIEFFDESYTPNQSDKNGRYSYSEYMKFKYLII